MKRIYLLNIISLQIIFALGFAVGCNVQPNTLHERNEWTEIGYRSGKFISEIHADVFEEAAEKEWENPKELSDYLLKRSREELPKTYKAMGVALALELGDEWDKERVQYILKEIAKGYREVR